MASSEKTKVGQKKNFVDHIGDLHHRGPRYIQMTFPVLRNTGISGLVAHRSADLCVFNVLLLFLMLKVVVCEICGRTTPVKVGKE